MSNLDLPEGTKLFINGGYVFTIKFFESIAKYCGTRSKYIPFLQLMDLKVLF